MTGLRIATFNLENLDVRPDQARPFAERVAVLRPQLVRLAADVLCLQEVNAQLRGAHRPRRLTALDRLLVDTPYAGYHRATTALTGGEGPADRHNLVVLSRFPILASRQVHNELVPPLAYRFATALPMAEAPIVVTWDRPLLQVTVELPSGHDSTSSIYTSRLRWPPPCRDRRSRRSCGGRSGAGPRGSSSPR